MKVKISTIPEDLLQWITDHALCVQEKSEPGAPDSISLHRAGVKIVGEIWNMEEIAGHELLRLTEASQAPISKGDAPKRPSSVEAIAIVWGLLHTATKTTDPEQRGKLLDLARYMLDDYSLDTICDT